MFGCVSWQYEIVGIAVFIIIILFFVMALWFKSALNDIITSTEDSDTDFVHMYKCIKGKEAEIFTSLCKGANRIQDCSEADLNTIFDNDSPSALSVATAAILENYADCTGIFETPLSKYYFTGKTG